MLLSLSIRDIVLIDRLDLEWQPTLCTLTGETGAGKSILLDALGLATGARGDAGLVRQGCAQGSVTAIFHLTPDHPVQPILIENGLDEGGAVQELILRRQQSADGRSRAFCNDQPIGVNLLKQIGGALVEIHGQNESQALTDAATQRNLLDNFAGLESDVATLGHLYAAQQEARSALAAYCAELAQASADTEFLTHAIAELQELNPKVGEEVALADERMLLMNAEKIIDDLREAEGFLQGEGSVENALNGALRRLEKAAPEAAGALDEAISAIDRALIEAGEARVAVSDAAARITNDPSRLEEVEGRLFALRGLARKHDTTCDGLPELLVEMDEKLSAIHGGNDRMAELETAVKQCDAAYEKAAMAISEARQAAAGKLDAMVNEELVPLKLDGGKFSTEIERAALEDGTAHGLDRIRFVASTNPGMAPGPIAKIASGGELARFMLALKVSLAAQGHNGTLIFDEVDAGVGGAVAEAVGTRLHRLAQNGQVLVVTHSPQVAARGNHHWQVSKSGENGSVSTSVVALEATARLEEVARMLSGANITDEARAAAQRLLEVG
ncbi:MAG: DNA repair protein RecN [PS1 clade bacterium]|uniref:DNA repair protein RecN n=1 Tax=PS1 clade bacterium TaxID=2175152 RepID=A0A937HHD6_9PROT|nr:DNA repair protein RecN [PS1 clade bacterium]